MSRRSDQPSPVARRAVVAFQVFLVLATVLAPIPVAAVDPSAPPSDPAPTEVVPTPDPTPTPTEEPATPAPTDEATSAPTDPPTAAPTDPPTAAPSDEPSTAAPTDPPSSAPTSAATDEPTVVPTDEPTVAPTDAPIAAPTTVPEPTPEPSSAPSVPVTAATIKSDLEDYPPGGLVTLTGANWQPGESVHIFVNDDFGSSWSRNVDVTADASGNITDQFNLPNWFVADYSITATGQASGVVRGAFTDSQPQNPTVATPPSSVTVAPGNDALYGTVTVTFNGNSDPCTITLGLDTPLPAGAHAVFGNSPATTPNGTAITSTFKITTTGSTPAGTTNFHLTATRGAGCQGNGIQTGNQQLTLVVAAKADQATLTITAPTSATFNQADATITTSGGSGTGSVSFDPGTSTACSVVSGKLHVLSGTGTCSITATKAGDANFNPTTSVAFTVSIAKADQATLTITAPTSTTFGQADATITTSGGSGTGSVSFDPGTSTACSVVSGKLHVVSGTGSCSITATKAGDDDYGPTTSAAFAVTVNKAHLTVTADNNDKLYGAANPSFTATISGFVNGQDLGASGVTGTAACQSSATTTTAVGTYGPLTPEAITCTIGSLTAANYDFTTFVKGTLTINQRPLTITADDDTKFYGQTKTYGAGSTAFTSSGLQNGETIGSVTLSSTGAGATAVVGDYPIVASAATGGTFTASNYDIDYEDGTLTVNKKALTITALDRSKVLGQSVTFDQTTPSTDFSVIGLVNTDEVDSVTVTSTGAPASATIAGSPYAIVPSGAAGTGLTNYEISYVDGKLSVLYSSGACLGSPGHQILQPVNANWSVDLSVFKQGSTVPAKFRVCDANGNSIGAIGVVTDFKLIFKSNLPPDATVDETVVSTTPDTVFRWSSSDQQWIFNINTKNLTKNATYGYKITLNDGSTIEFRFGLK